MDMQEVKTEKRGRGRPKKTKNVVVEKKVEIGKKEEEDSSEKENREKRGRPKKTKNVVVEKKVEIGKKEEEESSEKVVLVGRYVNKEFEGYGVFLGKVVSYSDGFYRAVYEDGDAEDLESHEVLALLIEEKCFNAEFKRRKKKLDKLAADDLMNGADVPMGQDGDVVKGLDRCEIASESKEKSGLQPSGPKKDLEKVTDCAAEKDVELDYDMEVLFNGEADSSNESCEFARVRDSVVAETPLVPPPLLPVSSGNIGVPEESVSHLFSVYSFLRSYSIQLFLSPFQLDDFVGSLNCQVPNSLLDCVHFTLLRALRRHLEALSAADSVTATKCLRRLDWSLLDTLTWPVYLVEYLLVMRYTKGPDWKGFYTVVLNEDYYSLSVTMKLTILQILCDDVIEAAELRAEVDSRESLEEGLEHNGAASLPSENGPRRVHPRYAKTSACNDPQAVNIITEPHISKSSHNTSLTSNVSRLGSNATDDDQDGNSDECRLCGMDGTLVCCDACPSAYHSRCMGLNKMLIPDGLWFCPECTANKAEPSLRIAVGLRGAEIFGIDPYEHIFMGICNHLLVLSASINAGPSCRYYHQNDIPKVLQVLSSAVQHKVMYTEICSRIAQYWGILEIPSHSLGIENGENPAADGKEAATISNLSGDGAIESVAVQGENHPSSVTKTVENMVISIQEDAVQEVQLKNTFLDTENQVSHPGMQRNDGVTGGFDFATYASGHKCSTEMKDADGMPMVAKTVTSSVSSEKVNDALNVGGTSKGETNGDSSYLGSFFKPQSYINQYFLGDLAASAAASLVVLTSEEKGVVETNVSSNPRKLVSVNTALQLKAFSTASVRFFWPNLEKKLMEVPRERCGWCHSCKAVTNSRRGCLLNLAASNAIKASARILVGLRPIKSVEGSIPSITTYLLYMEESLHGLVVGPFLSETYRKQWHKQVEKASTCSSVKFLLLKFEEHIRSVAFSGNWLKLVDDWSVESFAVQGSACSVGPTPKRPAGRRSKKQAAIADIATNPCDKDLRIVNWWRGGKLMKLVFQRGMLPHSILRKAARRQGGSGIISGLHYGEGSELSKRSRRLAWRASVEVSKNAPQLALQVRYLDFHVRWSDLVRAEQTFQDRGPEAETFRNGLVGDKKFQDNKIFYGLTFGNQKHLPSRVMKNVIKVEENKDGKDMFWFSEDHIPLFLIKEYEEKTRKDTLLPANAHALSKLQRRQLHDSRKEIFSFLTRRREKKETCSCACCKEDVLLRDAVKCSECEGFCHKDCTALSIGDTKDGLDIITCHHCYNAKSVIQVDNFNEGPLGQMSQQGQEYKMVVGVAKDARQTFASIKVTKGPHPTSSLATKRKRGNTTYGLIWKKREEDNGTNFRLSHILPGGNINLDPSRVPECCICHKPYSSDFMYICCERCQCWYHADAVELKEGQVSDLIGFKCCKCRRKSLPVCPYDDQESRRARLKRSKQGTMGMEPGSETNMEDMIIAEDDPLLFSLERVELIPESSEFASECDASEAFQGPRKLQIRRHAKHETDVPDADTLLHPADLEPTPPVTASLPEVVEYDNTVDGVKEETFGYEGVNYEGEYEPQTYFSFRELLATDDNQADQLDAPIGMPDTSWGDTWDCGIDQPYDWPEPEPEQYEMDTADDHQEPPVPLEPAINRVLCVMCSHSDPAPNLSCEICGICIHSQCSPWIEEAWQSRWRCGNCREWR